MSSSPSSPPSERRLRANRANAALSKGPVTPEGKARSSANALRHGLCAKSITAFTVVLANEDITTFEQFHQAFIEYYEPEDDVTGAVVEELAVSLWRVRRAWAVESALFDREMDKMAPGLDQQFADLDRATRIGLAFQSLSDNSRTLHNLMRYESKLSRQAERLRTQLTKRKKYETNPIPKSDT